MPNVSVTAPVAIVVPPLELELVSGVVLVASLLNEEVVISAFDFEASVVGVFCKCEIRYPSQSPCITRLTLSFMGFSS